MTPAPRPPPHACAAHGLREMDEKEPGARRYMYILMGFAVFGGLMFTVVNRILTGGEDNSVSGGCRAPGTCA